MAQLKIDVVVDDHGSAAKLAAVESGVKGIENAAAKSATAVTTAAQKHSSAMSTMASSAANFLRTATGVYGGLLLDKGISALIGFTKEAFRSADAITNLSAKSGLSAEMLQRLEFVGMQAGVSMQQFADASYMVGVRLGQGSKGVVGAVKELGLDFQALKAMNPDQQMNTILVALSHLSSEQDRNRIGQELFGRSFKGMAAAVTSGYEDMANAANVATNEQMEAVDRLGDAWDRWVQNRKSNITGFLGGLAIMGEGVSKIGFLQSAAAMLSGGFGRGSAELVAASLGSGTGEDANNQMLADAIKARETARARLSGGKDDLDILSGRAGSSGPSAAQMAAEKLAKELDRLSGREAISVADDWMRKVDQIGGITKLAAKDQEAFNKALDESLDAMIRLNGQVDPKVFNAWVASMQIKAVTGLGGTIPGTAVDIGSLMPSLAAPSINFAVRQGLDGLQLPGAVNTSNLMPQQPGFFGQTFGGMKNFGMNLGASIMNGMGGGLPGIVGSVGSMIGGTFGSILGPLGSQLGSMLGGLLGPLADKLFGPTEYEKRTRREEQERQELQKSLNMTELQKQADFTGHQDILTGITSGLATKNDPEYLRGLVNELNEKTQQLQAAMDRYGISWEQLGEKARQSQIDQMAQQFILDFQLLTEAGANVDFIIQKMSGSVNEFIQTSIRTGTEVPIAMQPMLQKMSDMGLLVDATGAQMELSSITWSMTMTQGFQSVAAAIEHLASALGYQLPAAAQAGAAGVNAALAGIRTPSWEGVFSRADAMSGDGGDVPVGHSGGLLWKRMHTGGLASDEIPLIGQKGEFMMSRRGVAANGLGVMNAMNSGQNVGGGLTVNVTVHGDVMSDGDVGEVVGAKVFEAVRLNKGGLYQRAQASLGNA